MKQQNVVIIGGGFAGIRAALTLANKRGISVKLISNRSFFEYRPALYRTATGRSPFETTIPLRDFFGFARNVEVIKEEVDGLDVARKIVKAEYGAEYKYDKLIMALGSVTAYFGIKGIEEYSFGVRTIHEALKLKQHIHQQLIDDSPDNDYVVVGAGPTGTELSAELVGYIKSIYERHSTKHMATVNLIEAAPRPMPSMPESLSRRIDQRLTELGIKTFYNTAVQSGEVDKIELPTGPIKSKTVVWTAGMTNNPLFKEYPDVFKLGKGDKVEVNDFLEAAPDIYVVGDGALTQYSGMAQTAVYDGRFVAKNILRSRLGRLPKLYKPRQPVYATPVGPNWAAVLWGRFRFYGRFGALLRNLADIRFFFTSLPLTKAIAVWRYGHKKVEICHICQQAS